MNNKSDFDKYRSFIRQQPEFRAFRSEEFNQLAASLQVKSFGKGQVLFDQGDTRDRLYYVIKGVMRLERSDESGNYSFINYVKANKAFPYRGMFIDHEYPYTASAMTPIVIASFSMPVFEEVLLTNRDIMKRLIAQMGQIINSTENRLQRMVTSSASSRVQHALIMLGEDLGETQADGTLAINYPITLIELARVSGTTRETAGQVVAKLAEENKISYQHKNFRFNPSSLH
ncbi:Crp/Fnr family transcriptional regulator [Secundilactobacillus collinoides]|uniref:cAMP-binding protein n=2 Tax=Secundilactobacillus collinoides TaxID=33960 RepID=A0A0R2BJA5_SECCO|nr:Crp/Fnr family transcriptional regulator [Secundilactobacillus collinoides]KRM75756.1 cAMP-binding protein [Secundilactobacillus collinoides DSM 20515 = JCM 1123]KZL42740.1 hypothetical protein TY91_03505 [Secundilactobacillus collinoides]